MPPFEFCIKNCTDDVTTINWIWEFPNQKTWKAKEVHSSKNQNTTFRSGDRTLCTMQPEERNQRSKRSLQEENRRPQQVQQRIQQITNHKALSAPMSR